MRAAGWPFVGRAAELRLLEKVGDTSVVVSGGVGVGKSRLLAEVVHRAAHTGATTLSLRATASTGSIPFGVLAPWVPEEVETRASGRLGVMRAVVKQLERLGRPMTLAVDDAHLLDEASAAVVLHLVMHSHVRVLATVRAAAHCPDAVVSLWKENLAELLDLEPLSESAVLELASHALGGELDPVARRRLWTLTGGTPLYLRELLQLGVDQGVLTCSGGTWRWQGDLACAGRLSQILDANLGTISATTRRAVELVALGEPLPVELAHELGCIGVLADAENQGLVTLDKLDNPPTVRVAHPLYGEVLRANLTALMARHHQATLATAAFKVGWHDRDPLRVATWCLGGGADVGSPSFYLAAAHRALGLAAWELAGSLAGVAEERGAGPEATLARVAARVQLGGWRAAGEPLADLDPGTLDDTLFAEYTRLQAASLIWGQGQTSAGRELLARAAARLRGPARARVSIEAANTALQHLQPTEALRLATEATNDAGPLAGIRVPATAVASLTRLLQGRTAACLQETEAIAPLAAGVLASDPYPSNPVAMLTVAHCLALVFQGRLEEATAVAGAARERAAQDGIKSQLVLATTLLGRVALLGGRLAMAQECGWDAWQASQPGPSSGWPAAIMVTAAAQRGVTGLAAEVFAQAEAIAPAAPIVTWELSLARAWLLAARGNLPQARVVAAEVAADAASAGAWLLEVLALLDVLRLGATSSAATRLADSALRVDGPYAAGAAVFAQAAVHHDGDGLDQASARFEAIRASLLAAEAAAMAAVAHQAAGRRERHRASLGRARLLASRCDHAQTPALRDAAAISILEDLTRREREVIELAVQGLTNREIAGRLFISIRTVNAHLSHIYAKVGINDRQDLATILAN